MSPRLPLVALLAGIFLSAAVLAAPPSANSPFGDLHWRNIGPFRGGRVLAVTGVPQQPQHFYFGSVNGGVWESHDAGRTWQPIFDDQSIGSIGAIAVAPSNPDVIYVGSGEADMRSDIAQGDGVYKSTDAGKTWSHIGLDDSQQIGMIRVDPHDANRVFVAALGHPYAANAQRGVFRSRDGGVTWIKVLGPNDATGAIDLAFDPRDANTIYAALWQVRRTPWNIYPPASGPGSGLYKSTDGGDHWTHIVGNGFPDAHVGRIGIAISDATPDRIYAIVDADAGGLYRSDDAGKTWKRTSADARIWQRGWYFGQIAADPKNPDRVYAMNTIVLRSDDGGKTFTPLKGDPTGDDYHELWIDPHNPNRQILGIDQGAVVTVNGGATWSSWHNQSTAQMYHVSTDNRFPYRVYGAQQDSGAVGLPSRAPYHDRISMEQFHEVTAGGEAGMIAPDPDDPDIVYGGTVDKLNLKTQQTHSIDPTLADPDLYRHTWTLPLVFNQVDRKALYFGNQKIWRTHDGGAHWDAISPDLTRENPGVPPNLDAVTAANNLGQGARRGVVYSIASSPLDAKLLWAGTDDGLVWRSADEGAHWSNITPTQLTAWSKVGGIEPSHFDADTAYVAVDRHRLDDRKPYIYRTHDAGKTWTQIVNGIRAGDFVNVVREDPKQRGLLYAGTELGMYLSFDDGDHWQPLQQNLPRTSVRDIDVKNDDLVIATHGRGFWIMDDVSALRQMDGKTSKPATRLFAPAVAVRVRPSGFTGTPLPKDEPTAENPPWGAYFDYSLAKVPSKPIELSIYDANGALVRRYSSADAAPKLDLSKINATPDWLAHPLTLQTSPGLHRFVWPLRYPALPALAHGNAYADGVWAPPGHYSVELKVDGEKYTQALTVVADPRVKLAADAYAQQFDFAREIAALQARLTAADAAAGSLHKNLLAARKTATGEQVAAIDALDVRVVAAAGIVDAPNPFNAWAQPPTSTSSFSFLDSAIAAIATAADDADVAPSPDARTGFAKLRSATDAALHAWDTLRTQDMAALNAQLKKAGAKPIAVP